MLPDDFFFFSDSLNQFRSVSFSFEFFFLLEIQDGGFKVAGDIMKCVA